MAPIASGNRRHDWRCPQNLFRAKEHADDKEQSDIQGSLVEQGQHKGLHTLSHGLKNGDDDKQQRIDGYAYTKR